MRGWRPALRMAWRDTLRARGRSVLVLVMIALPVLAVTTADIIIMTQDVSGAEGIERRIGAADAEVSFIGSNVRQAADPNEALTWQPRQVNPSAEDKVAAIRHVLGDDVHLVEHREGDARIRTDHGTAHLQAHEVDLREAVTEGLFTLERGRVPENTEEAVVTDDLADRGPGLNEDLEVVGGPTLLVVGIVEDGSYVDALSAVSLVGGLGIEAGGEFGGGPTWLVDAGGAVAWTDVLALNREGAMVTSAVVLRDPPPASELDPDAIESGVTSSDDQMLQVVALIVVMILIEVVLLAGPSFAVGARRQQRNLALIAVSGGTPRQMRRVILASGVVLGCLAAAVGLALGVLAAWLLMPVAQGFAGERFGPFDVRWTHLLGIAAFGLVSALLAALVPAYLAARQDVVAVLGGRRGDPRRPSLRLPLLGLLMLGTGIFLAYRAARRVTDGEFGIAVSAVPTVLGMVLLIPLVLVVLSWTARWLPLPGRFALRDAVRHRTRTVPAVAAVAATVAGVVALGIAVSSDQAERRETYVPTLAMGDALVRDDFEDPADARTWVRAADAVRERAGEHEVVVLRGTSTDAPGGGWRDVRIHNENGRDPFSSWSTSYGAALLVATEVPHIELGLDDGEIVRANEVLRRGGAAVLATREVDGEQARMRVVTFPRSGGRPTDASAVTVEAEFLRVDTESARAMAIVPPVVAKRLDQEASTVGMLVRGPVGEEMEQDIEEAVNAVMPNGSVMVERGYQEDDEYRIVLLVLTGLGAVLMLGGTLTATFLALSDARPDLATLGAVGGAPRFRRAVAAAYALVVGLVGAVIGAVTGFVPGIAVVYPLTSPSGGPYLDIPWLLIGGVVVGLPLVTAAVVGLCARSRLPMVARVE